MYNNLLPFSKTMQAHTAPSSTTTRRMYWLKFFILSFLTPSIAECHVRRNLEYMEKNGVPVNLITPAMFQEDSVDEELAMSFLVPPIATEDVALECLVFSNASDLYASEGIVVDCEHIGWLDEGDWLAYNIPLNSSATTTIYNLTLSVTSPLGDGSFRVENYETQEIYATVENFPLTEDWNSYTSVTASLEMANATDNNNVTILIRSLEPGWTFRDLCLQEGATVSNSTTAPAPTEPTPTEPVPTEPTPTEPLPTPMPSAKPTLIVASATVTPSTAAPTVVSSQTPTKVVTPVPQEMTPAPTTAVVSEAPSDAPSYRPTIAFEGTSTILPTAMPTMAHTTLAPSHTYAPSMSDYPSVSYEGTSAYKKSSKKSKRSGKGSLGKGSLGKGSTQSGKGSTGKGNNSSGKGSLGKGDISSRKGSSGKGNISSGKGSSGNGYTGSGKVGSGKGNTGSGKGSSGKANTGSGGGNAGKGSAGSDKGGMEIESLSGNGSRA